jgi:hypothetical protein
VVEVAVALERAKLAQPVGPVAVVAMEQEQAAQAILLLLLLVRATMVAQERLNPEHMVQVVVVVQVVQEQLELLLSAGPEELEQYQLSSLQHKLLLMQ